MSKKKLVQGWGINDLDKPTSTVVNGSRKVCPYYKDWGHVLGRVFSPFIGRRENTYIGCTVDDAWQYRSNFHLWVDSQPNHDWKNCHLDKDILFKDNKHYGPTTCVYVPFDLNMFLTDRGNARGEYPLGVYLEKDSGKFKAQVNNPFTNKKVNLGRYSCPEAAHLAWKIAKHELACMWADKQEDIRISEALRNRFK